MLGVGLVVGGVVALVARRWPVLEAPRIAPEEVADEIREHPSLCPPLRRHYDPKTETGVALITASAVVIAGTFGVGLLLTMVRENVGFARWDSALARFGANHASEWTTRVLKDVSLWFGSTLFVIVLAVVVCIA